MRRQLKLRGQLARPLVETADKDISERRSTQAESCDGEAWGRQQEGDHHPWAEAPAPLLSVRKQPVALRPGTWQRPEGSGGSSSEQRRSCSIAKLRAKAREHEAELHSTANVTGRHLQPQTQQADDHLLPVCTK